MPVGFKPNIQLSKGTVTPAKDLIFFSITDTNKRCPFSLVGELYKQDFIIDTLLVCNQSTLCLASLVAQKELLLVLSLRISLHLQTD